VTTPARLADPEYDWGYTSQARDRSIPTPSTPTNLTVIMLAERIHQRVYAPRS
jgi:hypothetical protein